jgi:heme a synthase
MDLNLSANSVDWRLQIPEHRRRHLRTWFLAGAALTFLILVIGGITRLTQSGLSIVDWRPIMGVIPPLNEGQWREAFEAYRQFPEYQLLRRGMSLEEFKFIFFWEYVHRLAARLVGVVFLVPFLVFWVRGYFNRPLLKWSLGLFALGAMQGLLGWLMVASGLVDRPSVSHFRLAAHLSLALVIFGCCIWLAREMSWRPAKGARASEVGADPVRHSGDMPAGLRGVYLLGALLALQIVWGAFVAGLKAGMIYNTFPLMAERLIPPGAWELQPWVMNLLANSATVQWTHRVLGTVLLVAAVLVFVRQLKPASDPRLRVLSAAFLLLVGVQYAIGVATLLLRVPVTLGVLHQAMAAVVLAVWLLWLYEARNVGRSRTVRAEAAAARSVPV